MLRDLHTAIFKRELGLQQRQHVFRDVKRLGW